MKRKPLDLEKTLDKALESHERAFVAHMASEPSVSFEAKENAKESFGEDQKNAVGEYDGFDPFTWTQIDPKTGSEKYFRRNLNDKEPEEYNGIDDFTWTRIEPGGRQRHFRSRSKNDKDGNDSR